MNKPPLLTSNFAHLQEHDEQLLRLGMLAERYFPDDPNTCLLKLRQLAELLAQLVATKVGLYQSPEETQYDLLRRLQDQGILPREIAQLFGEVRRAGNAASHAMAGDHRTALAALKITWQLGLWFHRTFRNPSFKSGPFIPPQRPTGRERRAARRARPPQPGARTKTGRPIRKPPSVWTPPRRQLREAKDEQTFWEQMASEAEQAKAALGAAARRPAGRDRRAAQRDRDRLRRRGEHRGAAVQLDEAETRKLIDQQLRQAGWKADSATLTYSQGHSPREGQEPGDRRMADRTAARPTTCSSSG